MQASFRPPFSKGGAVEAAEASSRSAEREIPSLAFLFAKLFLFALWSEKKKRVVGLQAAFGDEVSLLVDDRSLCHFTKTAWQENE